MSLALLMMVSVNAPPAGARAEALDLFEQRILPIFNSPNPSSCTECHLSGVELKDYILPSHEKTFVSLRDQGLIDLKRPERSKILRFISMQDEASKSALISAKVRKLEYEAFAAWIKASCRDPQLRQAASLPTRGLARPSRPPEVIRYGRNDRVLASFVANIWSQRFRCTNCHAVTGKLNEKIVREHGVDVTWIRPEGPAATMQYLADKGHIDLDQPAHSRFLRKATGEIKHGGGVKMRIGDAAYSAFRGWLEDYARVRKGGYAQASDLPQGPTWFGSEIWLRVKEAPVAWQGKLVRMTVHPWDAGTKSFADQPIAQTSTIAEAKKSGENQGHAKHNPVDTGWGTFAHMTLALRIPDEELVSAARAPQAPALPPGRYQVRIHVAAAPSGDAPLSAAADVFSGKAEIASEWKSGYASATELAASQIQP